MNELLSNGTLVGIALAAIGVEAAVLIGFAWLRREALRGLQPLDVVGHLGAGALLLLALRSVVLHVDYRWTLALLAASFPAHLFDLSRRARIGRPRAG